jgi:hypothetical protein
LLWAMVATKGGGGHPLLEPKFAPAQHASQTSDQEDVVEAAADESQVEPEQPASSE